MCVFFCVVGRRRIMQEPISACGEKEVNGVCLYARRVVRRVYVFFCMHSYNDKQALQIIDNEPNETKLK